MFEGLRGLKGLEGASDSFEPVEKERLGLPHSLIFCHQNLSPEKEPLGLPQPLVWQLQEPFWHLSRGLRGLKGLT